ncbi:MAG: DnaB-like helicase N-terminal domain-containing protein [Hyphomicrobiales bacterium]
MRGNGFGVPPLLHEPDAELAVLGALVVSPEARARIGQLDAECFYAHDRRRAFEIIAEAIKAGGVVDATTLRLTFAQDPDLGEDFLAVLVEHAATPINAGEYAELLRELHRRRLAEAALMDGLAAVRQPAPRESMDGILLVTAAKLNGIRKRAGPEPEPEEPVRPLHLPEEFWQSRSHPWLKQFRAWAHGRRFPADASLVVALTRKAAMLPSTALLDTGLGTMRPPNMYACIVGTTGRGKTMAIDAGCEAVPRPAGFKLVEASPASGEGIEGAFCRKKSKESGWTQICWNAWFFMDEGKALESLGDRSGAVLAEKLRSAWSGVPLISALADGLRRAENYCTGFALAAQPAALGGLMGEADLGGPARFLFATANDPTRPRHAPQRGKPLLDWTPPGKLGFTREVRDTIGDEFHLATTCGDDGEALDSHRNMLRARVAILLAVCAGRDIADIHDWELAGLLLEASESVRASVLDELERKKGEARAERLALHVAKMHAGKLAMEMDGRPIERVAGVLARATSSGA